MKREFNTNKLLLNSLHLSEFDVDEHVLQSILRSEVSDLSNLSLNGLHDLIYVSELLGKEELAKQCIDAFQERTGLKVTLTDSKTIDVTIEKSVSEAVLKELSNIKTKQLNIHFKPTATYPIEEFFNIPGTYKSFMKTADLIKLQDQVDNRLVQNLIGNCKNLTSLFIYSRIINGEEFNGLSNLTSLKELNLSMCTGLKGLPDLSNLTSLEKLNLSSCSGLEKLTLNHLTSLKELNLWWCTSLKELTLSNLTSLEKLDLARPNGFENVTLSNLTSLKELDLRECKWLKELTLNDIDNLKSIVFPDSWSPEKKEAVFSQFPPIMARNLHLQEINNLMKRGNYDEAATTFFSLDSVEYLEQAVENFAGLISFFIKEYPDRMERMMQSVKISYETLTPKSRLSILPFLTPDQIYETLSDGELLPALKESLGQQVTFDRFSGSVLDVLKGVRTHNLMEPGVEINPAIYEFLKTVPLNVFAALALDKKEREVIHSYLPLLNEMQLCVVMPMVDLVEFLRKQPLEKHAQYLHFATTAQKEAYLENVSLIPEELNQQKETLTDEEFFSLKNKISRVRTAVGVIGAKLNRGTSSKSVREKIKAAFDELDRIAEGFAQKMAPEEEEEETDLFGNVVTNPYVDAYGNVLDESSLDKLRGVNPFTKLPLSEHPFRPKKKRGLL